MKDQNQLQENRLKKHAEECPLFRIIMELLYRTFVYKMSEGLPEGILFGKTILQTKFEYCPRCGQRFDEMEG